MRRKYLFLVLGAFILLIACCGFSCTMTDDAGESVTITESDLNAIQSGLEETLSELESALSSQMKNTSFPLFDPHDPMYGDPPFITDPWDPWENIPDVSMPTFNVSRPDNDVGGFDATPSIDGGGITFTP